MEDWWHWHGGVGVTGLVSGVRLDDGQYGVYGAIPEPVLLRNGRNITRRRLCLGSPQSGQKDTFFCFLEMLPVILGRTGGVRTTPFSRRWRRLPERDATGKRGARLALSRVCPSSRRRLPLSTRLSLLDHFPFSPWVDLLPSHHASGGTQRQLLPSASQSLLLRTGLKLGTSSALYETAYC